jgi:transcription-repair coupling factor (superfamily II helicase)
VVSYPEAIAEKVITGSDLKQNTLKLTKGEKINADFLHEVLQEYKFIQVDFVYEPGQYSVRGSIVDIFSYSAPIPYRIDFFGNEVESIRTFDTESQLSVEFFQNINIIPNPKEIVSAGRQPLPEYFDGNTCVWTDDILLINDRMNDMLSKAYSLKPAEEDDFNQTAGDFAPENYYLKKITSFKVIEAASRNYLKDAKAFQFRTSPQPAFNKNFNLLAEGLAQHIEEGYKIYILSDNEKQIERLQSIFEDIKGKIDFIPVKGILHEGFADNEHKFCCYTDHQIFERYHKYQIHNYFTGGLPP